MAIFPPETVVAMTSTVPALIAVTFPFTTVATFGLVDCHLIALLLAVAGLTVAVRVKELPTAKVWALVLRLML